MGHADWSHSCPFLPDPFPGSAPYVITRCLAHPPAPVLLLPHFPTGFTGSSSEDTEPCPPEHLCGATISAPSVLPDPGESEGPHWRFCWGHSLIWQARSEPGTPGPGREAVGGHQHQQLAAGLKSIVCTLAKVRLFPGRPGRTGLSGRVWEGVPRAWSRAEPPCLGTGRAEPSQDSKLLRDSLGSSCHRAEIREPRWPRHLQNAPVTPGPRAWRRLRSCPAPALEMSPCCPIV